MVDDNDNSSLQEMRLKLYNLWQEHEDIFLLRLMEKHGELAIPKRGEAIVEKTEKLVSALVL